MVLDASKGQTLDALSDRERAVAEKFASGMTYREIGKALFIAPTTVRTHLATIYEKLGVRTKVGLAAHFAGRFHAGAGTKSVSVPVLAVLPIESYSTDGQWLRFADGLSADIIIDLARYSELSVIAFHTMKAYRGNGTGVAAVGRDVGADYILEGQLRVDDRHIRLTVQLSDARSGGSLWSERYDRPIEDVFLLQDRLTENIINVLAGCSGKLAKLGRSAIRRKPPASLGAYDCFLLGLEQHNTFTKDGNAAAIRLLTRATELDPDLARAWTELAYAYSVEAYNGFSANVQLSIRNWETSVEQAMLLDPMDCAAYTCMGDLKAAMGDLEAAAEQHERALEFGYNQADTLVMLAGSRTLVVGDPVDSHALIERALRLNPLAPPWYFGMKGRIDFVTGRYANSIAALKRSAPDSPVTLLFLAMAYAASGGTAQSELAATRLRREFADFSAERFIAGYPVTNPPALATIREGARLAGLP